MNKGDDKKPNCRSRLEGKEIKRDKRLDLFAADATSGATQSGVVRLCVQPVQEEATPTHEH